MQRTPSTATALHALRALKIGDSPAGKPKETPTAWAEEVKAEASPTEKGHTGLTAIQTLQRELNTLTHPLGIALKVLGKEGIQAKYLPINPKDMKALVIPNRREIANYNLKKENPDHTVLQNELNIEVFNGEGKKVASFPKEKYLNSFGHRDNLREIIVGKVQNVVSSLKTDDGSAVFQGISVY
jgi:hypothetical protein